MANNYFHPADCNLHKKKDWNGNQILVVHPSHIPPTKKDLHVHVNLQSKFEFEKCIKVLPQPLNQNLIPLLIQTTKKLHEFFNLFEKEGVF